MYNEKSENSILWLYLYMSIFQMAYFFFTLIFFFPFSVSHSKKKRRVKKFFTAFSLRFMDDPSLVLLTGIALQFHQLLELDVYGLDAVKSMVTHEPCDLKH